MVEETAIISLVSQRAEAATVVCINQMKIGSTDHVTKKKARFKTPKYRQKIGRQEKWIQNARRTKDKEAWKRIFRRVRGLWKEAEAVVALGCQWWRWWCVIDEPGCYNDDGKLRKDAQFISFFFRACGWRP